MSFTPILCFSPICATMQHRLQPGLPDAELPPADAIARSRQFRMPPLDRIRFERDGAMDAVWKRLLAMAEQVAMPDKARIALARLKSRRSRRRDDFDWRRSGERNTARGAGRARVRGRSIAGALRPSCGAPRCRSAGAGRSRRVSRLWRSAGVHHGGRLEWSARDPLLRLLAVRDALELSAHQMRAMRLDQGHCVSRDCRRTCYSQSRNLRILPFLRQDNAATRECFTRPSRRRRRNACP